jgi:hypothetical protein
MFVKSLSLVFAIAFCSPAAAFAPASPTLTPFITSARSSNTDLRMSADFTLDPSESALVLIEYQNEFTTEGGKLYEATKECMEATNMLSNSKKMMDFARDAGCTIIHVPINFEPVRASLETLLIGTARLFCGLLTAPNNLVLLGTQRNLQNPLRNPRWGEGRRSLYEW